MNKRGRTQPACTVRPLQVKAIASVAAALFEAAYAPLLFANPTGAQVVAGGVTVSTPSSSQMNITQSTPNAIVNWNTFSIATGESVNIAQPSAQAALLNRVMGNDPSTIAGSLRANGKVLLVNPAGVIFSPGSSVNVGSLVASTLGISNADFLAGNFHFVGKAPAAVTNAGTITAADGGTIALLGGTVTNSGTVAARLGTVAMGAGGDITLDFAGDGLTTIKINAGTANALLGNTGTLAADGGTVVMSAQTAQALADTVINQQGIVRAQSLAERDGHIILDGGSNGVTLVSGTLDASGGAGLKGGQVDVTGYDVALLAGANVNASGAAGGGAVRFGGGAAGQDPTIRDANAVWMDPTAQIHADALANGNGGHIVAYGTTAARLYGTLSAQGGPQGGDGGLIETSGGTLDVTGATINASAANGKGGQWLLDPTDAEICASASGCDGGGGDGSLSGNVMLFGPTDVPISDTQISLQLTGGTSVKVSTPDGNINVDQGVNIAKTGGGDATLTLSAGGSITLGYQPTGVSIGYVTSISSTSGALRIELDANVGNATSGKIISLNGASNGRVELSSNGGDITIGTTAGQPTTFDGASVQILNADIDARALTAGQPSGSITIHGQATSAAAFGGRIDLSAVGIYASTLNTSTGDIEIEGNLGSGAAGPVNGVYISSTTPLTTGRSPTNGLSSLSTESGAVRLYGIGSDSTGTAKYQVSGVDVDQATQILTDTGPIDIRGQMLGSRTVTPLGVGDQGVVIGNSVSLKVAGGGTISIAGSTNSVSPGVVVSSIVGNQQAGNPDLSPGHNGTLIIRAANNNSANSFEVYGAVQSTTGGGTLILLPGVVNSDFSISNSDATSINVNIDTEGFSINPIAMGLFSRFGSVVIGSSTQTGPISVYSASFPTNVTLETDPTGSSGISLIGNTVMPGNTLTLISGGQVSEYGTIEAAALKLAGVGPFTLNNTGNAIGTLSAYGTGTVDFFDSQALTLSASNINSFNAASGTFTNIGSAATMSLAGNFTAQTSSGSIYVDTPIESTASGATALTLKAAGDVNVDFNANGQAGGNITIGAAPGTGPLNVTLDARVGGRTTLYGVRTINTTFNTNGGTFTINDSNSNGAPVNIQNSTLNTQGGTVSITGTNESGDGVVLGSSSINAAGGNVTITGTSLYDGNGITFNQSSISTGNGIVTLTGTGDASTATSPSIYDGISISSVGPGGAPAIDVTGTGAVTLTGTMQNGPGVGIQLAKTSISANGGAIGLTSTASGSTAVTGILVNASTISNTGGAVTLTGNGAADGVALSDSLIVTGAGNTTLTGTATGSGTGVSLSQSGVHAGGGSITLTGVSTAAGTSTNYGVDVQGDYVSSQPSPTGNAAFSATGAGTIGITGTATNTTGFAYGVTINSATLNGQSGNVQVTGMTPTATTNGLEAIGVSLSGTSIQTGAGAIGLTGSVSSTYVAEGVVMSGGGLSTDGGTINVNGTATTSATSGAAQAVVIGPLNSNSTVALTAGGNGGINITGTTTALSGYGVNLGDTTLTSGSGAIGITGTQTGGSGLGVILSDSSLTTAGGDVTLTGTANVTESATGVDLGDTLINSGAGNVLIGGTVNITPGQSQSGGYGATLSGSSILTTSGTVTLNGTVVGATTLAYGLNIGSGYSVSGTNGTTTVQPTIQTSNGAISLTGNVPATTEGSVAVDLTGAAITSTGGAIALTGNTTGTPTSGLSSDGVVLTSLASDSGSGNSGTVTTPTTITTGSGSLKIDGSGFGSNAQGVLVAGGSTITSSNAGTIDIRGVATSPTNGGTQYDYGTLIYNGTISATAPNTTISIAGSTNTADAGLAFGAAPVPSTFTYASGPVKVNAGTNGTLALRAANDGTTSSFVNDGATITANDGTLALMPASVNPSTFNFTALDGTPITLFGTGAPGLSIDATAFSLFSGFSTFVLGSSTQTGLITVSGVCASSSSCTSLTKPSMNENLTLMNLGAGSQGIQLLYGISLGANTLTLASAGAVTDPGGIQAAGLLLDGPGTFTLNDPENNVGVLAMLNVGNVNFLNSTSFVIGPIVSHSFDAASNTAATIDATNSNLTGNLLAQAATGGIGLGGGAASAGGPTGGANTNLSAGGTIDLVMENGVFTDNGTGSVSANNGWRIWASTWVGETRGNVQPNTLQPNFYGCSFGAGCVWGGTVPLTGDHFVYVARPTVTVTANGVTRVWGAPNPNFTYTTSGLINGDTAAGALSGTLSTSANSGSLPGQYAIDPSFLSGVGYIVIEQPGTLNVVVPQPTYAPDLPLAVSGLQSFFGPSEKTFVYENNLQGTNICVGSNQPLFTTAPPGENQDLLAVEWKRVRSQPNLNSCMLLNGQHGCGDF
ncbi:filamentous hemagglutinin family protein [Paraburkholderia unamae]|uniref:Filamentous hemagglutinin family protein n=2 Tax=Paraburkholderia unamae TaxID=219649 RepID=A0ABX5KHH0_9BURK|nr:filamentous hemagglutinin N-terminal domain-containing protein [Paraburkholderia unamae]PVX75228.1 filamentous hemagglutinin family protein [Paraburkholderia unamae]